MGLADSLESGNRIFRITGDLVPGVPKSFHGSNIASTGERSALADKISEPVKGGVVAEGWMGRSAEKSRFG